MSKLDITAMSTAPPIPAWYVVLVTTAAQMVVTGVTAMGFLRLAYRQSGGGR
jgi:hypothetical protein